MTIAVATLAEMALRRLGVALIPVADRPMLVATDVPASIATAALIELGVIAADETPSAADQALAVSKVNAVHDSLASQAIVWWESSAIPRGVAEEYVKLSALYMASSFGKTADPAMLPVLEARVRRMSSILSATDIAIAAVMAVHNDQVMRGRARWSSQDIPDSLSQPYVMLAAALCAPEFDRKADPLDMQLAETAISRYIALPTSGEPVEATYF
jgi:hypothetical protein